MPILDIEIVAPDSTLDLPSGLAQSLAEAAAQVFAAPQGTVWVKVRTIPSTHYAEDHGKPEGVHPVFVTVLKSRIRAEASRSISEEAALENEITRLTKAIAKVLKRPPENVHITYQPDGAGRAAFGGKLVR